MLSERNNRSILVTRPRFLGDVILTLPAVRALKKAFPGTAVHYLTQKPYAALLERHPDVDSVLALDTGSVFSQLSLFARVVRNRFDVAVDLFGNPRSAFWVWFTGAPVRIGGDFRGRRILYTHRIPRSTESQNAVQFHLSYLRPLGISPEYSDPRLYPTEAEIAQASRWLRAIGCREAKPLIGIHPGATWPAKRWLPDRFAQLASRLKQSMDADILLTEGPGEAALVNAVQQKIGGPILRAGVLPLRFLAAVLSRCNAFVTNDCGPMHMAPAVGTPTIGIFGPGEPEIWFPYRPEKGHRFVHAEIGCSRCHRDQCQKLDCMEAVTVDMVSEAVRASVCGGAK